MRKYLLFFALAFFCSKLVGQDYYDINFSGVNADPQTILVKNLTRGFNIEIQGNQTLRLRIVEYFENNLVIYPNPSYHSCNIEFAMVESGNVTFQLYDLGGRHIGQFGFYLYQKGGYTFLLSGLPRGSFMLRVKTPTAVMTGKIIVFEQVDPAPKKVTLSEIDFRSNQIEFAEKSGMSIAEMKYWPGDNLAFVGKANGYPEANIYSAPDSHESHTFVFAQNWPNGYFHCNEKDTEIVDVLNPITGRTWMDRNLGASQVATSSNDALAFGDRFQWGRFADGHQCPNASYTYVASNSDQPGHSLVIDATSVPPPRDWRLPQNDELWQGVNGVNNPCPIGYRLPTEAEFNFEQLTWATNDADGAFSSPLKLTLNSPDFAGWPDYGLYWTSTTNGYDSREFQFDFFRVATRNYNRSFRFPVRCLKDEIILPYVITTGFMEITPSSANINGLVAENGGANVTSRGFVWNKTGAPTLTNSDGITLEGQGEGEFESHLTGLTAGTYFVRAYATNMVGTNYGRELSLVIQHENYLPGTVHCGQPTEVVRVTNPITGRVWMDRNLGASRAATSLNDEEAYGDLYQWGRLSDGHQCRFSETTTIIATHTTPGHSLFIVNNNSPYNWQSTQNSNLWQIGSSVNNPCPLGYRVPTKAELDAERQTWGSQDSEGAFASPLKLTVGGYRSGIYGGERKSVGLGGFYWSNSASANNRLGLFNNEVRWTGQYLVSSGSVRCIATPFHPILTTKAPADISGGSATSGGNITNNGEDDILAYGVVWSKFSKPTIENNEGSTIDGFGLGEFTSQLSGLTDGIYYVRAYATNSAGTGYGNEYSFVTQDDNYQPGTVNCGAPTEIIEVTNPITGKSWMDRNLGASRSATSPTDQAAYGDLYQWGRFADGHQCRNSATTSTQSISDSPGHGMFITSSSDWRATPNHSLWQGYNGTNNPCPKGYRPPTQTEFNEERISWLQIGSHGAFDSPLKLTLTGERTSSSLSSVGGDGHYWTSFPNNNQSRAFRFSSSGSYFFSGNRNSGKALRCIAGPTLPILNTIAPHLNEDGTANSGGNIIDDNQTPILERGVVWSHNPNPSIDNNIGITNDGTGVGLYASLLTGLEGGTYYVRAFAINEMGTSYGRQFSLVIDNQQYPQGSVHCGATTEVVEVFNPNTGKVWMDRNLGASRAATESNDAQAYGDRYQWGRFADGHQCRNSPTTSTLSNSDQPGHGSFITGMGSPRDWRSPQNDDLWQGFSGTNNPCPEGFRIPTEEEWKDEIATWSEKNAEGAFASSLKLPVGLDRNSNLTGYGRYWSSTISGSSSRYLRLSTFSAQMYDVFRERDRSVRCIKAGPPPLQPSEIFGPDNPCKNQLDLYYGVYPEPDVIYTWSVPNGWSITDGQGTPQIVVNSGLHSGIIEVVPKNANGFGPPQTFEVTISQITKPIAPTAATHNATTSQITWNWNQVIGADGYKWHTVNDFASAIDLGTATSYVEDGLICSPCGINYTRYVWAFSNQCGRSHELVLSQSTASCPTQIIDVVNPATGATWMDRNLGASQVAANSIDSLSFGDLYQWGRLADGHQCRNSPTTTTLSNSDQPGHGSFILAPYSSGDWRSPRNTNLWQGASGVNNPCPSGYRLPTEAELNAERLSWGSNNTAGAFASPLKLPVAGYRSRSSGSVSLFSVGSWGLYWSSTASNSYSRRLEFNSSDARMLSTIPAAGLSVRCIKD